MHLNIALSRPAVVVDNANQGHAFRIRTVTVRRRYNSRVKTEEFRILLALEPSWSISINGREFLHLRSSEIELEGEFIRFGRMHRRIVDLEFPRLDTVRVRVRSRLRSQTDRLVFYAGEKLPFGCRVEKEAFNLPAGSYPRSVEVFRKTRDSPDASFRQKARDWGSLSAATRRIGKCGHSGRSRRVVFSH